MAQKIRGMQIGALNTGETPLVQVEYGQTVGIDRVEFEYVGPSAQLFICWAPKPKASTDFNNGNNIPGGQFGYAALDVQQTQDWDLKTFDLTGANVGIQMNPDIHIDDIYDAWVWMTEGQATSDESFLVAAGSNPDTDADVIEILLMTEVRNFQVNYVIL